MPCPDPQVPADAAGSLVVDLDDPILAALPPDLDLPGFQVQVGAVRVARVVADPGQLGEPDAGRPEHRDDRGVAALCERVTPAGLLQFRSQPLPCPHRGRRAGASVALPNLA
jgi:hypothetical protein